ncbi:hypothetical protein ILYODFUR_007455 [Ilyodon furcidens]|uniref:Uncharacterized protein n=1 Tax=Ilyodon furcidens TaxID=33524 RepID=A0ABV0V353_9TELE
MSKKSTRFTKRARMLTADEEEASSTPFYQNQLYCQATTDCSREQSWPEPQSCVQQWRWRRSCQKPITT